MENKASKSKFYDPVLMNGGTADSLQPTTLKPNPSTSSLTGLESAVQSLLITREDEYIQLQPFRILCATWNVNGQPCTESLHDWLSVGPSAPDVYAIGFQELDLSKEAFLFTDSPREEDWFNACVQALHPKAKYCCVKSIRLIGMMLLVFAKKDHRHLITNIAAETVGTGLLGRMGNKGGVAVRFDLCNTSFCFVNCHLAAHVEEFERRNQDYNEINNRLLFTQSKPFPKCIQDHDQVYWFGDLNYRITSIDSETVKRFIASKDFETLLSHDQLSIQLHERPRKVFAGFTEGPIRHLPTYKYDPGTDDWDSSEKNRPPAWTDRVLFRGGPTKLLVYRSHPKLKLSDHKPVTALFESSVKVIDNVKYRKTYQDVMKKLDKIENELLPQVTVDKTDINFGIVTFRQSYVRYLVVQNTGQIGVTFSFLKKPNQATFCKDWLRVKPNSHKIRPGQSLDIELEIFVDKKSAARLNNGQDHLTDILVLHLEHGRDLFITISASYQPSVFGSSIEFLVRLRTPIKELTLDQVIHRQTAASESANDLLDLNDDGDNSKCWDIPKEIWILVDHLYKKGLLAESLFLSQGLSTECLMIRDALDSGNTDEFHCSIHSVAESLLMLLESFHEPVVPFACYTKVLDASQSFALCQEVISQLPTTHKHVFYYVIAYLREFLRNSSFNKSDPQTLSTVFAIVLIRAPPDQQPKNENPKYAESQQLAIDRKRSQFIHHFLINEFDV